MKEKLEEPTENEQDLNQLAKTLATDLVETSLKVAPCIKRKDIFSSETKQWTEKRRSMSQQGKYKTQEYK